MRAVWKYQLTVGPQEVRMPAGAEVVHVAEQEGVVTLWAIVDPRPGEEAVRRFHVIGTGTAWGAGDDNLHYLGSCMDSPFVWHVFEEVAA